MSGDTMLLGGKYPPNPEDSNEQSTRRVAPLHLPDLETPNSVMMVFADNPNALQFELTNTVVLGRRSESAEQPDVDLAPYGAFPAGVSRRHIRLTRMRGQVYLEDMGTRNGTFLNDEAIMADQPYALKNGEMIRLGHLKIWVYFATATES